MDMSSGPQNPHKRLDLVAYACNLSAAATDKQIPGFCLQNWSSQDNKSQEW